MSDEAWFVVRNTPGVTGFIGSSGKGAKPFPLTPQEVDKILGSMGMSRLEIGNEINVDDMVKVVDGPFANMFGKIKSIDMASAKLEECASTSAAASSNVTSSSAGAGVTARLYAPNMLVA